MRTREFFLSLAAQLLLVTQFVSAFQHPVGIPEGYVLQAPDPDYSPKGGYFGPLLLPNIVRYEKLPLRMYLDPMIPQQAVVRQLDERLVPLWERMLREGTDPELLEAAALHLARVADLRAAGIEVAEAALQKHAESSENRRIRYAAAYALAAGDLKAAAPVLIRLAEAGDDSERLLIEPALIRWKSAAALELWNPRISDQQSTNVSFDLAVQGLDAIRHEPALDILAGVLNDPTKSYVKRMASCRTVASLSPNRAFQEATKLVSGTNQDKLLALSLLNSEKPEACTKMAELCLDASDAVASIAWQQLFKRNSELLLPHLDIGRKHRDSQVRLTAARAMVLWPTAERATWLQTLLSDIHIEVRNVARMGLVEVAAKQTELKPQIIEQAAAHLKPDSADWQGLEQSLLVLAQLQATQFSQAAFNLLGHAKDEVVITASWLIQLYPDDALYDQVRKEIEKSEEQLLAGQDVRNDISLKETMLLQYAGLVRMKEIEPLADKQFSKSAPGAPVKRASALWALAIVYEKTANEELAGKFEERIKDINSTPPEFPEVRHISVLALGLLRSTKSISVVENSGFPELIRWVLPLLGQPMPPELEPIIQGIAGWRITPAGTK